MSRPQPRRFEAPVLTRDDVSSHLVRITLATPTGFASTGIPDEWVAITLPGQFQTRYYTLRAVDPERLVLDVVLHEEGLVTEWARGHCVGDVLGLSDPKGSYDPPHDAAWVVLLGDLTALPAIARIAETTSPPVTAHVESVAGPIDAYTSVPIDWLAPPTPDGSGLADFVANVQWPDGDGYFWMAGESAQMRAIRHRLRHELSWPNSAYDVMGYWSTSRGRRVRAADPRPSYDAGRGA